LPFSAATSSSTAKSPGFVQGVSDCSTRTSRITSSGSCSRLCGMAASNAGPQVARAPGRIPRCWGLDRPFDIPIMARSAGGGLSTGTLRRRYRPVVLAEGSAGRQGRQPTGATAPLTDPDESERYSMASKFLPFCARLDRQAPQTRSRWSLGFLKNFTIFGG